VDEKIEGKLDHFIILSRVVFRHTQQPDSDIQRAVRGLLVAHYKILTSEIKPFNFKRFSNSPSNRRFYVNDEKVLS
jgi:hypothetical protein